MGGVGSVFKAWLGGLVHGWWLSLLVVAAGTVGAEAAPFVYVANSTSNSVSVIDAATRTVVATVAGVAGAYGIAITPDGASAYVTTSGANTVTIIDTASKTVVTTVPVGSGPQGVAGVL